MKTEGRIRFREEDRVWNQPVMCKILDVLVGKLQGQPDTHIWESVTRLRMLLKRRGRVRLPARVPKSEPWKSSWAAKGKGARKG